ncbi:CAP domain-containing protein [Pseudarthrobacter sp. NPDC058362]|uniref:CAP domain-containing protein n=1 Tax=Pseudarthrobacter sp. NPDC058362 TaxID=3346458 RepID=UPI00365FF9E0
MKKWLAHAVVGTLCTVALVSSSSGALTGSFQPEPSSGSTLSAAGQPASAPPDNYPPVTSQKDADLPEAKDSLREQARDAGASRSEDFHAADDGGGAASMGPSTGSSDGFPDAPAAGNAPPADTTRGPDPALASPLPPAAPAPAPSAPADPPAPGTPPADTKPSPNWIPALSATDRQLADSMVGTAAAPPEPEEPLPSTQALVKDSNAADILKLFNLINEYRVSKGLAPLKYHATVAGMAQEWSDSIASREVIEHRANFWLDPRALSPDKGAGEVISINTIRDPALLVNWWKGSPGHNALLLDPRFNVMGAGITYTDSTYKIWGVVNFFGYSTLPAGTTTAPGGSTTDPGGAFPAPPPSLCDPTAKHMPPTLDLSAASINSAADIVTVNASGQLLNRPSTGAGTYGAARAIGSGFGSAKEVFTTDWDRDGAYDLLTQWNSTGNLTLHRGLAGGGFQSPLTLGNGGWDSLKLAVGGWCANNRMPQILALDTAGNVYLYPNRGVADLATRVLVTSGVTAARITMVDYNADGFEDVLAFRTDGAVVLYRGVGTTVLPAEIRATVATGWQDVTSVRPLRDVTALNSKGLALRRGTDVLQYWDLSSGKFASPSSIAGTWAGQRLAQ